MMISSAEHWIAMNCSKIMFVNNKHTVGITIRVKPVKGQGPVKQRRHWLSSQ